MSSSELPKQLPSRRVILKQGVGGGTGNTDWDVFIFTPLSLFFQRNRINSHLGLVRSSLPSISVVVDYLGNGAKFFLHNLSLTVWVNPRGANPQIEQCANRNISLFFSHSAWKPKEISTLHKKVWFAHLQLDIKLSVAWKKKKNTHTVNII